MTLDHNHAHYGDAVRHLRLGESPAPTHMLCRPVAAYPIVATDRLADGIVSVLVEGEMVLVDVPRGFAWLSTPVQHDMLVIGPDGEITHRARVLFDAEAEAIPRRTSALRVGQQIASRNDVRPSGTMRVLNADGDTMTIPVAPADLPLVPRFGA